MLFFLFTFSTSKASAARQCTISSILPENATENDSVIVTATIFQSELWYTLSVANTLEPLKFSTVGVNTYSDNIGSIEPPTESVELKFLVGQLTPGNYTFTIYGRENKGIEGQFKDYCFYDVRGGFEILTLSGQHSDIGQQMGWNYDANMRKCKKEIGGIWKTQQDCESRIPNYSEPNPNCKIIDLSELGDCKTTEPEVKRGCLTLNNDSGFTCPDLQAFCIREGQERTEENVLCEEPHPPCTRTNADGECIAVDTAVGIINTEPQGFVRSIFTLVLGLSGGIALILIIISGYKFMTSQGNPEKTKEATERLTSAIIGLLFIIFAFVILEIVGVDILKIPGFSH